MMPTSSSCTFTAAFAKRIREAAMFAAVGLAVLKQEPQKVIGSALLTAAVVGLTSCGGDGGIEGYDALSRHVGGNRVGGGSDQWIEMVNVMGSSERVGLVFGYMDDRKACLEAIAGMREANPGRDYVCTPAN